MTKELRERLYEKFKSYYDRWAWYEIIEMEMLALLEQEILEAERRGREEVIKKVAIALADYVLRTWKPIDKKLYDDFTAISSLK